MRSKARDYTDKTLKRLFGLSGNQCAFPGCSKTLVNPNNAKDSNICHIEAANGDGERYNASMTDKERADYENLILLCIQHHDETNDVAKYTVNVLKKMKRDHESGLLHQKIINNPSMLRNTINAISKINFSHLSSEERLVPFDPRRKIEHNAVKKYSYLIEEYKVYHQKLNSLYEELEKQGSVKKEKILRNIETAYLKMKGNFVSSSENQVLEIRDNSDRIFDAVYDKFYEKLESSGLWDEDIVFGINLILIDGFMRCKILEEPPKNDS